MAARAAATRNRCGCRPPDPGRGGVLRAPDRGEPLPDGHLLRLRLASAWLFSLLGRCRDQTQLILVATNWRRQPPCPFRTVAPEEWRPMVPDIFHRDFTPTPYWWEAYAPTAGDLAEVPRSARVAIVGGGYAGLSTALELAKQGIDAVVLEANELGFGASTRNGGAVSGGVNVGKSFTGRTTEIEPARVERILSDASDAFALIDRLIDEEKISCFCEKPGRFAWAWTKKHFDAQTRRLAILNAAAQSGAYMVPRGRQRDEIASDYYFGGMVVERSGKLHPALYYKGLLWACRRRSVPVCAKAPVTGIRRAGTE